jgi:hypothetical protein
VRPICGCFDGPDGVGAGHVVLDLEVRQESGQREDLVPDAVHMVKRKNGSAASVAKSTHAIQRDCGEQDRAMDSPFVRFALDEMPPQRLEIRRVGRIHGRGLKQSTRPTELRAIIIY